MVNTGLIGGVFFLGYCFVFCFFPAFGFLASWLFGFLASWLLGFSASWLFGFSASGLFGFLLVYAAFGGFLFSHPLHSQFLFGRWRFSFYIYTAFGGFSFSHPLIGFWIWLPASSASPVPPHLNHHFFGHHGGGTPPPQPTRYCLDCLQSNCTMGGAAAPPTPRVFDFLQRFNCTPS